MILSSMKTRPNLVDSFFLCGRYSSGICSCCWHSRQTNVFSSVGSFVVSFISSCKSVEKFRSVSLTACPRSQLFSSIAATFDACPILTNCTLFTPTSLLRELRVLTGLGPSLIRFRFLPLAWGRKVPVGTVGLSTGPVDLSG